MNDPPWTVGPKLPYLAFIIHCFLSFVICNIDRTNLTVAILPMSAQFRWSPRTVGVIQSSFFAGYMLTQVIGGRLADAHGGRVVLAAGVAIWSVCTAITPLAAFSLPTFVAARVLLGMGEGVAMPAMNTIVVRWVSFDKRARALSFIYSGMYVGSIVGLLLTPAFIVTYGWASVFYVFGAVGLIWTALFLLTTPPERDEHDSNKQSGTYLLTATEDPDLSQESAEIRLNNEPSSINQEFQTPSSREPPSFGDIMSRSCVWAIIVAHFCYTWGYFVLLMWLPSYLYTQFKLDVTKSSVLSATPWAFMFIVANVSGSLADGLIARGLSVTHTRKLMQSVGFIGPAVFLAVLSTAGGPALAMVFLTAALALGSFSQSGLYATHQDIGPEIAGTLLGITNTFATVAGLLGNYATGFVLDVTKNNWNVVFGMAIFFYLVGLVTYNALGTSERQW